MSFGSVFRKLRKEKNLTQDQIANMLMVTPQAISRWENGSAMPDISMLIPIANMFGVSTDTLLEVNAEKNNEHIADMVLHTPLYIEEYGATAKKKLAIYEEEVRKNPHSIPLKEALVVVLQSQPDTEDRDEQLKRYRRIVSLTEDILESGGGKFSTAQHQLILATYCKKLSNLQKVKEIVDNATEMIGCKEVLLPSALTGREQVEARKDLIYACASNIITTIYELLSENREDITQEEYMAFCKGEDVIAALYGADIADHYVLATILYDGVRGEIKRGNIEKAKQRLLEIVRKMEKRSTEPDLGSPIVSENQTYNHHLAAIALYSIQQDADKMLKMISSDFPKADALRKTDAVFDSILCKLEAMRESDGGQEKEDAHRYIKAQWWKNHPQAKLAD